MKINFNSEPVDSSSSASAQDENGWFETFYFPVTSLPDGVRGNMQNLVAARCSLLAHNCYVYSARFHKASLPRSVFDLNGNCSVPFLDADEFSGTLVSQCQDVQTQMLFRLEDGQGRRWEHGVRGVRDSWIIEFALPSAFPLSVGYSGAAPTPQAACQPVAATLTITVAGGILTAVTVATPGNGYPVSSTFSPSFVAAGLSGAAVTYTTNAAGQVISASVSAAGTGGTNGTTTVPAPTLFQCPAWGIPQKQTSANLLINYMACLKAYTCNFTLLPHGDSSIPSGWGTAGDTNPPGGGAPYLPAWVIFDDIGKRDTGRIIRPKRGRRKSTI